MSLGELLRLLETNGPSAIELPFCGCVAQGLPIAASRTSCIPREAVETPRSAPPEKLHVPMAMPTFDCARWATPLLSSQTDALSLVARARSESQRAKRDYEESWQVLCELQHRVETSDGRRQRDIRRMIKLETAAGLSSDLHRLVGTLAWQERRCATSTSKPPAVPGTLAWYRTLHSAPASEPAREAAGENVAGLGLPAAVKAKVNKGRRPHVSAPPCHFVAAGAVLQARQAAADGKAEPMDGGAQSDTESDTCSEASEASSSWSGSAAGSNDEEARSVQTTGTARDAGDDVQQLGGSSFGTNAVADLASAESSPARSRPNSCGSFVPVDLPSAPLHPVVKSGQMEMT